MSKNFLKGLDFTDTKKSYNGNSKADTADKRRANMLAGIANQIELANEWLNTGTIAKVRKEMRTKQPDGSFKKVETDVLPRCWFFEQAGELFTYIKHGTTALQFENGKCSIKVDDPKNLVVIYAQIREAVIAKVLDDQIEVASRRAKRSGATATVA